MANRRPQLRTEFDSMAIGDTICAILTSIYVEQRDQFKKEAKRRGITVEQMAAAAIAGMVQEAVEQLPL